jgi:hypothetical protein
MENNFESDFENGIDLRQFFNKLFNTLVLVRIGYYICLLAALFICDVLIPQYTISF